MDKISVDTTACVACGACVQVCVSAQVYEMRDRAVAARPEKCWRCGHCVSVCPVDAIDHESFPLEKCWLINRDRKLTTDQVTSLLRARRSVRAYAERPVPRDVVRDLVSVSRWGPSAGNSQDIEWLVLDDRARIAELSKATVDEVRRLARLISHPLLRGVVGLFFGRELARGASRNRRAADDLYERWGKGLDPIFFNAPVVLIGHARSRRPFARDDAIYAAYNVMLVAEAHGLATCQIGILQLAVERSRKVRRMLGLPDGRSAQVALVLGHSTHDYRRVLPRKMPEILWNPR